MPPDNVRLPDIGFDHLVPSNWFRPIAIAFREKGQSFATVDNLVDLTFAALGVLTRSRPRQILAGEIRKAIKAMARNGTFDMYRPDRVRLKDAAKLERYLRQPAPKRPVTPTETTTARRPVEVGISAGRSELVDADGDLEDLFGNEEQVPSSLKLPPLRSPALAVDQADVHQTTGTAADDDLDEDEERVLRSLYPPIEKDSASVRAVPAKVASPMSHALLVDQLTAILSRTAGVTAVRSSAGLTCAIDDLNFVFEVRLDDEVRLRLRLPDAYSRPVLLANQRSWYLAPIGMTAAGQMMLMRAWPAGTSPDQVAAQTLADVQFIRDAVADDV